MLLYCEEALLFCAVSWDAKVTFSIVDIYLYVYSRWLEYAHHCNITRLSVLLWSAWIASNTHFFLSIHWRSVGSRFCFWIYKYKQACTWCFIPLLKTVFQLGYAAIIMLVGDRMSQIWPLWLDGNKIIQWKSVSWKRWLKWFKSGGADDLLMKHGQ